jgi:uncharacterized protein
MAIAFTITPVISAPPQIAQAPSPRIAPFSGTPTDETGRFVALVLGDTEDRWTEIFSASGRTYHPPKLRLYSGSEPSVCGVVSSAMGPVYCPREQRIYLDTSFFDDMQTKFSGCSSGQACRLPEAIIIAREVGHHVQNELGILSQVSQAQQAASSKVEANELQVRVELQADCLAGIWANRAQKKRDFLDGDVEEALQALAAMGDDQRQVHGNMLFYSIAHGTSEQRKRWFLNGFNGGKISGCNTLSATP